PRRPDAHAEAFAAVFRLYNVLPEKTERFVVAHARDARDRLTSQLADEEGFGIGVEEARPVVSAGVPPLAVRPPPVQTDFIAAQQPDAERLAGLARHGFIHRKAFTATARRRLPGSVATRAGRCFGRVPER